MFAALFRSRCSVFLPARTTSRCENIFKLKLKKFFIFIFYELRTRQAARERHSHRDRHSHRHTTARPRAHQPSRSHRRRTPCSRDATVRRFLSRETPDFEHAVNPVSTTLTSATFACFIVVNSINFSFLIILNCIAPLGHFLFIAQTIQLHISSRQPTRWQRFRLKYKWQPRSGILITEKG